MSSLPSALVEAFVSGSHEAFRQLFRMYYPKVRAFVQGFVKHREDAEDLTQVVFIKLWDKRGKFSEVLHFDAYLFTLTKHTVWNYLATHRNVHWVGEEAIPEMPWEQTPHDELVQKDLQLFIQLVVEEMPAKRREIYRLSREQGWSNDEIAERLGIQKKTVENHLNLALRTLKDALTCYWIVLFPFSFWG